MSKLVRTLLVILVAFAVSSLLLYRLRLGGLPQNPRSRSARRILEETTTVEGQIQTVDPATNTLTLINNDDEELMLSFDERTTILDAGRPVPPATITSGTPATVKYTQRAGKKWARRIELAHAEPPDPVESY